MSDHEPPPRALVLGAGGFIGRWLARALADRGVPNTLVVRDRAGRERLTPELAAGHKIVEQELGDRNGVLRLVQSAEPSVIFNLVAYGVRPGQTDPALSYLMNEQLVAWLIDAIDAIAGSAADGRVPRLFHVGSAAEYGTMSIERIDEDTAEQPTTLYGASKLAGTRHVVSAYHRGLPAMCARLFMVYGPGEPAHRLVPSLVAAASSGEAVKLSAGLQRRDFTFVKDVAEALVRLATTERPLRPVVNIATGRSMTVRDFASLGGRVLGIPPERLLFGAADVESGMDHGVVDVTLVKALTGWSPATEPEEGLRQTAERVGLPLRR